MALISTEDAKAYLRVDSSDEDATVGILLASAIRLCIDIARLSDDQWERSTPMLLLLMNIPKRSCLQSGKP